MSKKTIIVSGGFDPVHVGHVRMIQEAAKHGDVTVVINSDAWLLRKKGYIFMPWEQRREIIQSITGVHSVEPVDDSDGSVCEALIRLKPDIFGNGGDRTNKNTPEKAICNELGIEMLWALGGDKIQSSSTLVQSATGLKARSYGENDLTAPSESYILTPDHMIGDKK
tara:strand:- start:2286 stop:2786 length:501 start_codon:yes stop_codon:yes gene_type:complete